MRRLLTLLALLGLSTLAAQAQTTPDCDRRRVELRDGRTITGCVVSETDTEIVVEDGAGVRTAVPRASVRRVRAVSGRFDRTDPNYTRLFFSPTARTLGKGAGRATTYYIFLPSVAYGVTDRVDVSAAASIPLVGAGEMYGIVSGNVKVGLVGSENRSLAVGASVFKPYGEDTGGAFGGTVYALGTFGTAERAVTAGAYGVYGGDLGDDVTFGQGATLMLGGENQLSNSIKLITENYVAFSFEESGVGVVNLVGVRFFGDRLAADFALIGGGGSAFEDDGATYRIFPLPYIGIAYNFGRGR